MPKSGEVPSAEKGAWREPGFVVDETVDPFEIGFLDTGVQAYVFTVG
jgi:hypothetical protein